MALALGMKKTAAVAAAALTLSAGAMAASGPEAHAAKGGWYNIRSGPGLNYPVIGKMYEPNCRNYGGGGPVFADGYIWNRSHSNGVVGWSMNDDWCV